MNLQSTNIWQKSQEHSIQKRQSIQQMVLGKLNIHLQKHSLYHWEELIENELKT